MSSDRAALLTDPISPLPLAPGCLALPAAPCLIYTPPLPSLALPPSAIHLAGCRNEMVSLDHADPGYGATGPCQVIIEHGTGPSPGRLISMQMQSPHSTPMGLKGGTLELEWGVLGVDRGGNRPEIPRQVPTMGEKGLSGPGVGSGVGCPRGG